ncbi:MAG: argininosuccinate lyase, partial [Flavisolibacter sp.]
AKCSRIQSVPNELTLLLHNLPSGYHRDLQLTKEILFPAIEELKSSLQLSRIMLSQIEVKDDLLKDEKYKYLFSVEAVNELVNKGIPFREAYQQIGKQIEEGKFSFDQSKGLHHTHEGSLGNLRTEAIREEMEKVIRKMG